MVQLVVGRFSAGRLLGSPSLVEVDGVALFPLCWVGAHAGVCGSLYRSDSGLGHAISLSHSRLTCTFSSLAALSL